MNTHIPGPWRAQKNVKIRPIGVLSESGLHVCDVDSYGSLDETTQANAQLIAAAPEMLEACRLALKAFQTGTMNNRMMAVTALRAIIFKIEGNA